MVNVTKVYLYIFPVLLALLYPQVLSSYHLELAIVTFFISFGLFIFKITWIHIISEYPTSKLHRYLTRKVRYT